jgi:dipeptidyl aminopeptidase/acylaminoacyl peptidase
VVYPNEGHHLIEREHRLDAFARTVSWFEQYMPAQP